MAQNINQNNAGRTITIPTLGERARRITLLLVGILSVFLIFSLLFAPFYRTASVNSDVSLNEGGVRALDILNKRVLTPNGSIANEGDLFTVEAIVLFGAIILFGAVSAYMLFVAARKYSAEGGKFVGELQNLIVYADFVSAAFFIASIVACAIRNAGDTTTHYQPSAGFAFWACALLSVLFAILARNMPSAEKVKKPRKTARGARLELFIYSTALSALAILCALGDILLVEFDIRIDPVYFNGFEALCGITEVTGGMQILVFFVLAFVAANLALFLLSLTSLIGRSRLFYQISLAQVVTGGVTTFVVGLFGKYFAIAEHINKDILDAWIAYQLERFGLEGLMDSSLLEFSYDIQSPSHWFFVGALALLCLILIRKPYSRGTKGEVIIAGTQAVGSIEPSLGAEEHHEEKEAPATPGDHDPCPAFTAIDRKYESLREEIEAAQSASFESPTLPDLVNFVVNYARDSRLHLSYTPEDIATFVAGLGATRLTILQGMSGTGKTSLPKIFAEAILGTCDLVEVESAWRDKNELLGYYNEFSRTYTPKKFTQALYRARLLPERPTFIVLDEMNLSRIEYYFSDFLSLMENEENKRAIKLLGTPLYRKRGGSRYRYLGLSDGLSIQIPANVWFIGTANRDESTFEISDKVYDRAHTMNFNKRAPKVRAHSDPIPQKFISAQTLLELFREAKNSVYFDIESSPVIGRVEALLEPYNISFGNRIANQIEDFVRIYAACFGGGERAMADGLERILLSKIVAKLEFKSVEDKDELAAEFERLGLNRCRDFVLSLNED
ncbi:MAG: hypothetical protein IKK74_03800 [Clostridia bacterium]|nr:hypothetical protein [Clostridia bacterium]